MIEYTVRPITDRVAFLASWEALYKHSSNAGFFHSQAWMGAWLAGASENDELHCIEARLNGVLMGLGVVSFSRRLLGMREAWFHEFADPARNAVYPEYVDFLIGDDAPEETRHNMAAALLDQVWNVDSVVFRNVTPPLTASLRAAAAAHNVSCRVLRDQPVYLCRLDHDDFISTLSKSLQTKIRRAMKLYEASGPLTAYIARTAAEKTDAWVSLIQLHSEAWREKGGGSVFENPQFIAFHERLQTNAPETVQFFVARNGDETIAVLYNFVHEKQILNYQSGFKFEKDNRMTPGFVAHALAASAYKEAGFEVYNLLAGEADYKKRLGTESVKLTSLVIERPTWRNWLRGFFKR